MTQDMHQNDYRWTVGKGMLAAVSSASSYLAESMPHLDPIVRGVMFFGGGIGAVLTVISLALDIRRKIHVWMREGKKMSPEDEPSTKV